MKYAYYRKICMRQNKVNKYCKTRFLKRSAYTRIVPEYTNKRRKRFESKLEFAEQENLECKY